MATTQHLILLAVTALVLTWHCQSCFGQEQEQEEDVFGALFWAPFTTTQAPVEESVEEPVEAIVDTRYGKVRGTVLKDLNKRTFYAFRGVPYAQAPIGDLRFKYPSGLVSWEGIHNATDYRNNCLQADYFNKTNVLGNEDCLYLNIFTPMLPQNGSSSKPMAVLFYIHGGMWLFGSGAREGPKRLMGSDVVLVTINYRLGAFGFLSTGDNLSPGNFGLFDQMIALRWVQRNILNFGGNPTRVTIFGHDAGAASVIGHIVSPWSTGTFHAAIAASGTLYWDRDIEKNPLNNTILLAEKVGCPSNSIEAMMHCLKTTPAEKIIIATEDLRMSGGMNTTIPFRPTIDKHFLSTYPELLFGIGFYNRVPLMTGVTKDEGVFYYLMIANAPKVAKTVEEAFNTTAFEELLPFLAIELYKPPIGQILSLNITERIRKIYFGHNYSRALTMEDKIDGILNATGDLVQNSVLDFTSRMFANEKDSVYTYRISFGGPQPSLWKLLPGAQFVPENKTVVSIGDELQFLFTHNDTCTFNADEDRMADNMVHLWTSFAKTGVPELPCRGAISCANIWKPTYDNLENSPLSLDINPNPYTFRYLGNKETFKLLNAHYYFSLYRI